ncbi:pyridoxamine 5'-phosphate oxidase family protein [Actinomadura rugatobispora]|uniref:Pyridoxamine 5'-phosphate oxidase family protein n=1 Tax=Actinomadura rugatobispora TaxID=1994 RepID=A0ABW1A9N2_9ACTN|nr:hypothetical protein GCM10010200_022050 [Actinomadura rugatobispora]
MAEDPRPLDVRKSDALRHLTDDKDLWISSGDISGIPTLVPLSFYWEGARLFVATVESNPTARNIVASGRATVGLGHTRDVVLIEAEARPLDPDELPAEAGDAYAAKCGWDPRTSKGYRFFELVPVRIQSWRELNEHADRDLMLEGRWLV